MKSNQLQSNEYASYYAPYVQSVSDEYTLIEELEISVHRLIKFVQNIPMDKFDYRYAEGKWTVKDILQHYIDTERVFTYRITAIARGDQQLMTPYDEEEYAQKAEANRRQLDELYQELILVRKGTIAMFKSFTQDMLLQSGHGFNGMQYCVLSLGFMLAGHQRWHMKVLEERYYGLLNK